MSVPQPNATASDRANPPLSPRTYRTGVLWLVLLCFALFFWRLGSVPLFDLDEGLYVTCARNMAVSGDIVTPRLNARPPLHPEQTTSPFFEKPILVYWASAASMRLFGTGESAARFPVALCGLLTTLAVCVAGATWFGKRAGLLAGLCYAACPLTILDARQMTTDGLLVCWFTLALFFFMKLAGIGGEKDVKPSSSRFYALAFWFVCALAVLTKGVVGLLLPLLVIALFLFFGPAEPRPQGERKRILPFAFQPRAHWLPVLRRLRPLLGLLLLLLLILPWHLAIWKRGEIDALGRTWVQEYLIRQHIGRFRGLDKVHNAPIFTYLPYYLVGFFPWACFTPAAFRLKRTNNKETRADTVLRGSNDVERFLRVWFWTIFLFFSLGAAKLPTYIAPAYPAAALLVGRWLDRVAFGIDAREPSAARRLWRGAWGAAALAGLLLAVAIIGPRYVSSRVPLEPEVVTTVQILTGMMAAGCTSALLFFRMSRTWPQARQAGIAALAVTVVGMVEIGCTEGYDVAGRLLIRPYEDLAEAARVDAKAGIPIVYYDIVPRRPSMLFYARDYAPLETGVTPTGVIVPLLPYVQSWLARSPRGVDIITAKETWRKLLKPEFAQSAEIQVGLEKHTGKESGGWVLLRLTQPYFKQAPTKESRQ